MLRRKDQRTWRENVSKQLRHCLILTATFSHSMAYGFAEASEPGVFVDDASRSYYKILIDGEITSQTVGLVRGAIISGIKSEKVLTLTLSDSPGGDVEAAMEIGRMVRSLDIQTWVVGHCDSSCALIFFASTWRVLPEYSKVGLHRPYFAMGEGADRLSSMDVSVLFAEVSAYLQEMGISAKVFDAMMATAPEDMLEITRKELKIYAPERDPIFEELDIVESAARHAISTVEYRKIWSNDFIYECGANHETTDWLACVWNRRQAALWRVPVTEVERKLGEAYESCVLDQAASDRVRKLGYDLAMQSLETGDSDFFRQRFYGPDRVQARQCVIDWMRQ